MKRSRMILPMLALHGALALVGALALTGLNGARADTTETESEREELFREKCGMCHRQGGTGTFMLGRRLGEDEALLEQRDNLTSDYVRLVVRNGIMSMPRFTRAELSDAELDALANYLTRGP